MIISRRLVTASGLSLLAGMPLYSFARAAGGEGALAPFEGLEDFWLATDAYIYGYPLVTMEMTRRVLTNVAAPEGTRAPMGQLIKMREYPNASYRDVTAPNADTLYTTAFFDVGKEPWVLSLPDMKDRYYLMPLLDGWTTVFQVPGTRTTGGGANLCDHRAGLDQNASGGCQGIQIADQHRLAVGPHLLHRHTRGLRRGPRAARPGQAGAAQRLRTAVRAAAG